MQNSIHLARWVALVRGDFARIVLLPVDEAPLAPSLAPWSPVATAAELDALEPGTVGVVATGLAGPAARAAAWAEEARRGYRVLDPIQVPWRPAFTTPQEMVAAVRTFRPDLVHTLEIQRAGYLTLEVKRRLGAAMPPWLLSNWGSDLYLYERLPEHRAVLIAVMRSIDGYLAECRRDVALARGLGLLGHAFEPIHATGGVDFGRMPQLGALAAPSRREAILVKGYHGWAGRGLHILSALHLAAPALRRFRIRILVGGPAVARMAQALADQDGLDVAVLPHLPNDEVLRRVAEARMVVGLGISDGVSAMLLEAMSLGAFPIQGTTSGAGEWVRDGVDGLLVCPHDVRGLADALARAAGDDALVDAAAPRNRQVVEARWSAARNGAAALSYYRAMLAGAPADALAGRARA
ncbi:glycosyltransferase [Methylobacterium crusticola]|nr:glycosyltransferase [Methylobacterium crusticola]